MKKRVFIDKVRALFDSEFRDQIEREAGLRDVCHALKSKKRELKKALQKSKGDEHRKRLEKQYEVVCAQQRKALKLRKKKKEKKKRD